MQIYKGHAALDKAEELGINTVSKHADPIEPGEDVLSEDPELVYGVRDNVTLEEAREILLEDPELIYLVLPRPFA